MCVLLSFFYNNRGSRKTATGVSISSEILPVATGGNISSEILPVATGGSISSMEVTKYFVGFSVGDTFASFDELSTKIKQVENDSSVQLYMRDSRTIEGAKKRMPRIAEKANSVLRYHSLQYCCVFGGKCHKTESRGIRATHP